MTILKKLIGNKSLNTKQCSAGSFPRIIPLNLYGNPKALRRIPANSQKFKNFPFHKNLLEKRTSSTSTAIFISSLYRSFICSCSHCCYIFFFFFKSRLYMNTHVMLILINQCLLNVIFSITKALTGQISPKYHFYYFHLLMLFRKLCFCLSLFSSFLNFLFYFKL